MRETVFLQNIISPYRANFFNALQQEYDNFAVYYMGESEPDKFWDVSKVTMNYPHWVDYHGWYITPSKSFGTHCNPILFFKLIMSRKVKNIVFAVSWTDLNIMAIAIAKHLHLTSKRIFFWAEANYSAEWTKKHNTKLKWWLKRMVFSSVDGAMIIPGKMADMTFEKWNIPIKNKIYLPNTINSSQLVYDNRKKKEQHEFPEFIMPFRLIERIKGGLNFFEAITPANICKAIFYVVGDGEDRRLYLDYVKQHNYEENIKVSEGFFNVRQMCELYNRVDGFILPSFSDASPLTLIEALNFHLPILCSNHCGNHYEAVEEGVNGFTFSPNDKDEIKSKFERLLSVRDKWNEMGEKSFEIYQNRFETEKIIKRFVSQYICFKK